MVEASEGTAIQHVVDRLTARYPEVPADTVQTVVRRAVDRFDGSRIRDFVPLFVERLSRQELSTIVG